MKKLKWPPDHPSVQGRGLTTSGEGGEMFEYSQEQEDLFNETFKSHTFPSAEQMRELAEKSKLTENRVAFWFIVQRKRLHEKEIQDLQKKKEALTLEIDSLLQGSGSPDGSSELRLSNEKIKLLQDKVKVLEQQNEQRTGLTMESQMIFLSSLVQLSEDLCGTAPTPAPDRDTGTSRYLMRKRAIKTENSSEQGKKNAK